MALHTRLATELDTALQQAGADRIAALLRVRQQIDAEVAVDTAALDGTGSFQGRGYRSPASFLVDQCRIGRTSANGFLAAGRTMKSFPLLTEAARDGTITFDHVKAFSRSVAPPGGDEERLSLAQSHETQFLAAAEANRTDDFRKLCQVWRMEADVGNVEAQQRIVAKTDVTVVDNPEDGTAEIKICGPRVEVLMIHKGLTRLADELWRKDNQASDNTVTPLRHKKERRFRAAVLMAERALARIGLALTLPEPLMNIQMDWATYERESAAYAEGRPGPGPSQLFDFDHTCHTADGVPISPSHMFALSLKARIRRVVFDAKSRKVDLGRESRLYVGGARAAVQQRDKHCQHPGCTMPAKWCDVDHIREWQDGGETNPENGQLLCRWHHTRKKAA